MRLILSILILTLSACSSGFDSNQAKYNQLVISDMNNVTRFDTSYFESQARSYLIAGTLKQQQKEYAASIIEFQEALRYDSSAAIEYAIAKSYLEIRKVDLAKEHLYRATQLNSNFVQAFDLLTEIFLYRSEIEKAKITNRQALEIEETTDRLITKALIIENDNPEESLKIYDSINSTKYKDLINERRIVLLKKLGRVDSLVDKLKSELKMQPFNTQISREIFQIYLENNQIDEAVDYMDIIDTLYFGKEQETYYILLSSAIMQNNIRDTILVNKFLTRINGTLLFNSELMYYSGLLASNFGNYNKRDIFFDRLLKIEDENSDLRVGVAEVYYFDKEYKRSLDILSGLNPDSLKQELYYYTLKGMNYFMQKEYEKSIENYKLILEKDSTYNNYVTLTMIGETFDVQGNLDSALYYYELHYNLDSNNTYLLNNYAYTLSKYGKDLYKALSMSLKTLNESPNNSAFLDTYGWIKYKLGDIEEAKKHIEKAIEIGNVSAEVYEHLGDIYIETNELEKAQEMYKKALELESDRFDIEEKIKIKTGK